MKKLTYTALTLFFLGQGSAMAQCPPGQVMLRDVFGGGPHCFQPCKTTGECPKDRYCSPNGNVCRLQCNKDSDCPTGEKCNKKTRGHFKCEAPQAAVVPVEVTAPTSPEVKALESEPAANVEEKQVETVIEAVEQDAKVLQETKQTSPTLEEINKKIDKLIKKAKTLKQNMKTVAEKEAAAKAAIAAAEAVKAAAATANNEKDAAALEQAADQASTDAETAAETAGEASGEETVITCPPNVFKGSTGAKEFTENNVIFKVMQGKNYSFSGKNALPFSSSSITRGGNGYAMRCFYQVKGVNEKVTVSASGINYKSCGYGNGTEKICTGGQPSDCALKCTAAGGYPPLY
jgi:hypothetical protein